MTETTRANAAQTAANAAATLFQGTGNVDAFGQTMQRIAKYIVQFGEIPSDAERQQGRIQNAQQNLQNGGVQAEVTRDLSNDEKRWEDALINNPDDWYNNVGDERASSGGGNGPDFKFKDQNANVKALWLNGKYGPAPAWVFEHLGLPFPGGSNGGGGGQPQQSTQQQVTQQANEPDEVPF